MIVYQNSFVIIKKTSQVILFYRNIKTFKKIGPSSKAFFFKFFQQNKYRRQNNRASFPLMEQQIIMNEVNTHESQLKQLFDEFKFHLIYKNKPKSTQTDGCEYLKSLLSQIKRQCRVKKEKKRNMQQNLLKMQAAEKRVRPTSTLQSIIWKPKQIDLDDLQVVKEELLIIQKQKQSLLQEISQLESSLGTMKKNVAQVKKKVEIEAVKEEKYKHISQLSKSIQRQTDTNKIINYRSYKKLVKYQEGALSNLKKFKTTLRKDNQDLQSRYIQFKQKQQNQQQIARNKIEYSRESSTIVDSNYDIKIDKSFIIKLQELIKLFIEKQPKFQEIKAEQTTKIRLRKIQKNYLKQERIRFHEILDRFEETHDVKLESLPNLIIYIYKHLNQDNEQMENLCIKHYRIKEVLLEDLEKLKQKQQQIQQEQWKSKQMNFQFKNDNLQKISRNSEMFIKLIVLLHNLLGKFKYLFTMALTLNIEKKNFQDLLIHITNIYKFESIFYQRDIEDNVVGVDDNLTNLKEMEDILNQHDFTQSINKNDLLNLIFSDLRFSLMFRRCWLQQEIKQGIEQNALLQKICSIQQRCEKQYNQKLKIYINLLVHSFKALTMNKYEKKMIASSTVRDSLFLSIPKPIKVVDVEQDEDIESSIMKQNNEYVRKFNSESSQQDVPNFQFKDNPRKIIGLLEQLKNEQKKTFKPFVYEPSQVYMYNSKVILPKYVF